MKKTLLSAAILAACCSNAALAVTDDNESEVRKALESQGLPIGGATAAVEAGIFQEMRDRDTSGMFFSSVSTLDSEIAGVITSESPLPEDPLTALTDMQNRIPAATDKLAEGGTPQEAGDILLNGEPEPPAEPEPNPVSTAIPGAVSVTVTGNVQQALSCTIASTDTVFEFGDIDLAEASVTSGTVAFSLTCSNETTSTKIYLTTGTTDPTQNNQGSNVLPAEFSDGVKTSDVNLAVMLADGTGGAGSAIGKAAGDAQSAGDKTATDISLVATLDTTQITSGSGGSLKEKGSPEIAVWVN